MTLKKSMQKLYLKLVGEATDKNNIAKIISDLADNYSGGSGEGGGSDGGSTLVVEAVLGEEDTATLNKTWQEIYDAFPNVCVSIDIMGAKSAITSVATSDGAYSVDVYLLDVFTASSADDYPFLGNR